MSISSNDFDYIRALVHRQSSVMLEPDKQYMVELRLMTLAHKEGLSCPEELVTRLRAHPHGEMDRKVVDAMMTNETMFFRDMGFFNVLRKSVLPTLLTRRAAERKLTLWCGASSSGQEPYSVAILLREHFPELAGWTLRFIASDISSEILSRAKQGCYSQVEISRGMPAAYLVKYFRKHGMSWEVRDDIRKMVEFRELNLTRSWPMLPEMDIIFLRNVLIYFEMETKKAVLSRAKRLLRSDGYLFVGGAETTINIEPALVPILFEKTVYYQLQSR